MRTLDLLAGLLAMLGIGLGIEAWLAGSLLRYVLAGVVLGGLCCVPLLSIVALRERARRFWRRLLFVLAPLLAVLLLVEIAMRAFGPPPELQPRLRADERLGHVFEPGTGGTDAWGFRNDRVPEQADALFVGDSQTWGFFIEREQTFPVRFAALSGATSYQMANGGYGPVRYRELLRIGMKLKPKLVVIGYYFGNDLWDVAAGAGLPSAADLRDPARTYAPPRSLDLEQGQAPNWVMGFADLAQQHSRLIGWLGEIVRSRLRNSASLLDQQPGAVPFHGGGVATILLPEQRRAALDLTNSGLADSLRMTEQCFVDIAQTCRAAGVRPVVLAIPTKEYCYAEWQRRDATMPPELAALHAAETAVRARIFAATLTANIGTIDLADACIAALATGTPVWAGNGDGHLMAHGHLLAARAIAEIWSGR